MRKSWVLGCPIFRQPIFHALVCWRLQHTWTNGPNQITVHNSDMWTHIISHHISQAFRSCPPSLKHWYTLTTYIYIHIRICQATCDPSGWFLLLHSWKPWVSLTHEALHYSMDLNFCVVSNDKEWTLSLCPYISLNCCPCLAIHLPTAGVFIEIPKLNMSTITIKNVSRLVL